MSGKEWTSFRGVIYLSVILPPKIWDLEKLNEVKGEGGYRDVIKG